jgi:hypothetical protein
MSQIKLLHSGGNGVSIVAPDSNPASDRTLKLPSDGDGTILTTNSSVGKILQVENFVYKNNASTTSSNNSYVATPLTLSITPTAANSKIYINYNIIVSVNNNVRNGHVIYRDINGGGFGAHTDFRHVVNGSNQRLSGISNGGNEYTPYHCSNSFLDSPTYSLGNAISYKIYNWAESNSTIWINRIYSNDSSSASYGVGVSTMTLMEIAA